MGVTCFYAPYILNLTLLQFVSIKNFLGLNLLNFQKKMGLTPTTSIHKFNKDYLLDSLFFNKAKLTHGGTNLDTSAPLLDISFIVELEIRKSCY